VERIHRDELIVIGATRSIRKAYDLATFHGRISEPDITYKVMTRRMHTLKQVIMHDTFRFTSEDEAKYSPMGDIVRVTKTTLF